MLARWNIFGNFLCFIADSARTSLLFAAIQSWTNPDCRTKCRFGTVTVTIWQPQERTPGRARTSACDLSFEFHGPGPRQHRLSRSAESGPGPLPSESESSESTPIDLPRASASEP